MADTDAQKFARFNEIGSTGLKRYGGMVHEEFLPNLFGYKAAEVYKEMSSNDPVVGALLFSIDMILRSVDWKVEPASDKPIAKEQAEFLEQCMDDMTDTWQDFISEALSFLIYGWSVHEIAYKRRTPLVRDEEGFVTSTSKYDDGKVGWKRLPIRAQETLFEWDFAEESGVINGMVQMPPPNFDRRYIPSNRMIHFRTTAHKNNPEGKSILRNAYRPWYFKKKMEEIEGIGVERDLAGLPMAMVPPELLSSDASDNEKELLEHLKKLVINVRRDEQEGIIFPMAYDGDGRQLYDFKLLSAGGARQFDTNGIIVRYEQRIAMSALADFLLLGHDKVGSFALSSDKTDLFAVALGSFLDSLEATIHRQATTRLFKVNGGDMDELPRAKHGDIESPNMLEIADFLAKTAAIGIQWFPDDKLEGHLRILADLPEKDEETIKAQEAQRLEQMQAQIDQQNQSAERELETEKARAEIQGANDDGSKPGIPQRKAASEKGRRPSKPEPASNGSGRS